MSTAPSSSPSTLVAVAAATLVLALTIYLLIVGETILIPLVMAIFITYLLVALSHALERLRIGTRRLPSGLSLAAAILLFLFGLAVLVQLIAGNVREVVEAAPAYQARLQELLTEVNGMIATRFNGGRPISITAILQEIDLRSITAHLAGAFQAFASNTFQVIIYVAFLLLELKTFDRKLDAMSGGEVHRTAVRATLQEIGHKIESYVLIKTMVSLLAGISSLIVLKAIGVDFAPFWALLRFALNFVPYVGALVSITLPALFTLLQTGSIPLALLAAGILVGIQAVTDNVLEPRLAGRTLNLSPVAIMLGLSIWGTMWGIIGMILSVPIMVMVMIVLSQFPRTRPFAVLMSARGEI